MWLTVGHYQTIIKGKIKYMTSLPGTGAQYGSQQTAYTICTRKSVNSHSNNQKHKYQLWYSNWLTGGVVCEQQTEWHCCCCFDSSNDVPRVAHRNVSIVAHTRDRGPSLNDSVEFKPPYIVPPLSSSLFLVSNSNYPQTFTACIHILKLTCSRPG